MHFKYLFKVENSVDTLIKKMGFNFVIVNVL